MTASSVVLVAAALALALTTAEVQPTPKYCQYLPACPGGYMTSDATTSLSNALSNPLIIFAIVVGCLLAILLLLMLLWMCCWCCFGQCRGTCWDCCPPACQNCWDCWDCTGQCCNGQFPDGCWCCYWRYGQDRLDVNNQQVVKRVVRVRRPTDEQVEVKRKLQVIPPPATVARPVQHTVSDKVVVINPVPGPPPVPQSLTLTVNEGYNCPTGGPAMTTRICRPLTFTLSPEYGTGGASVTSNVVRNDGVLAIPLGEYNHGMTS